MKNKITKAILPVAGLGTRVMPLTLHQPKAMIGIVDRPVVHYVIDEMISAGIKEIILVISPRHSEFKKYISYLLRQDPAWRKIIFRVVTQKTPLGNGDAIFVARRFIKNEPFLVGFGDDLLADINPPLKQLTSLFHKIKAPILVLESVPKKLVSRYGVVKIKKAGVHRDIYQITDIIEKPSPEKAPSNLTVVGRYILTPKILEEIKKLYPTAKRGKELYLTDALKTYLRDGGKIYGWHFRGARFDCGSKIGILKAQAYFGTRHPEFKKEFKKYLKKINI
ncbi:MAG: hypothetical protein A2745_00330 [Candidatus Harrisonbacteria bacterium RIFCSPHIGHO2_01_FULL_44_13]|nr:MAG: hypothetical protein A2745_00330 [Candidatus Harrisonbacteria bacterium RIFCSPHIGHO2_01_FULL_44_13]